MTSDLAQTGPDSGPAPPPLNATADSVSAAETLFALLYADLHQLARSRLRQAGELTQLHTTDPLHESFLRLQQAAPGSFPDKQHFMAYAARAMRSVVVDLVRSRKALRHGGELACETLHTDVQLDALTAHSADEEVLRVNEALADLAKLERRLATVVELRYFGGLTDGEIAAMLGLTLRTVQRDWAKARIYLSLVLR
jgi:RNA polymerase sigma factor (TIGR02999 family)